MSKQPKTPPPVENSALRTPHSALPDALRQKPLLVPWTWGEYYAIRYLSARRGEKLNATGTAALKRGMRELAREAMADHRRRGDPIPQRLALLAHGETGKKIAIYPPIGPGDTGILESNH